MTEHSEHGASISERWTNCHGSVRMARLVPKGATNAAAERGTALHEVAALCLTNGQDAIEYVGRTVNGIEIDADSADETQTYIDHCRTRPIDATGEMTSQYIECQFNLAPLDPPAPMFGTADHMVYDPETCTLYVDDLKTGYAYVGAGALQLRYYALGAMLAVAPAPVYRVVVAIVQPKNGGVKQIEIDAFDLMEWSGELLAHAAATLEPDAPLTAGPWCSKTYCPAAGVCPAYARHALAIVQAEFGAVTDTTYAPPVPETLTSYDLGNLKHLIPQVQAWIKDVEAEAARRAHLRDADLGWKIIASEGNEAWKDPKTVLDGIGQEIDERMLGLTLADITEPVSPKSPAQMRITIADRLRVDSALDGVKLTKKDAESAARMILAPFVRRPAGTALVPVTDSRPAIAGAGSEFLAITQES